jgi:hypothetical protein
MEAATVCVFLLLRFVSAYISTSAEFSRVRLIICLRPSPTATASPASPCCYRRLRRLEQKQLLRDNYIEKLFAKQSHFISANSN